MARWRPLAASIVITALLVWVLLRSIENKVIWLTLRSISLPLAALALLLYILIYLSRAWRFNALLVHPLRLGKMFTIMCLHNAINVALPARSGELSYPYLLKQQGVPYAESVSSLLAARLFDLLCIFLLFLAALPFVAPLPMFRSIRYAFFGLVLLVGFSLTGMLLWKLQIKNWIETVRRWTGTDKNALLTRIQHLGGNTVDALRTYADRNVLKKLFLHSLVQWVLMFLFSFTVLRALGMELTLAQSFVGSSLSMLVLIIPFQGVLGFGTTEAVWVVMFMALGFLREDLIPLSFAAHIVVLLFTTVMGAYGLSRMRTLTRVRSAPRSRRSA